jgi:hypothetical protein
LGGTTFKEAQNSRIWKEVKSLIGGIAAGLINTGGTLKKNNWNNTHIAY